MLFPFQGSKTTPLIYCRGRGPKSGLLLKKRFFFLPRNRSALKERIVDKLGRPLITEGEVRPTNIVPVIAPNRTGARTVFPMVWGFTLPRSSSPMVNARVKTASAKPTFKESWERRRCIVPASYYFEWEHLINAATGKAKTGDKYMIQPKGSAVTWIAGLYRIEDSLVLSGKKRIKTLKSG